MVAVPVGNSNSKPDAVRALFLVFNGALPINLGGGQILGGQPGLAGGDGNLVEALRQMRGEAPTDN